MLTQHKIYERTNYILAFSVGCCVVVVVVGTTELVVTTTEPCENDDVGSISTVVEDIIIFSVDVAMATDVGIDDIRALVETFIITELRSVLESVSETCIDLIFLLHLPNLQQ
jgi:hypothetical protein